MKTKKYIIAAVTLLSLSACQNDDNKIIGYYNDPDAVIVVPQILSRVNTEGNGQEWTDGDEFTINNITKNSATTHTTASYTLSNNAWNLKDENQYMEWQSGINTFNAWYPSTASFDNFEIPCYQDRTTDLRAADWMTATKSIAKTSDNKLTLEFEHKLAKVNIKIDGYNNQFESDAYVENPVFSIATINKLSGVTIKDNKDNIGAILSSNTLSDKPISTAILIPGKYSINDDFFKIDIDGNTLKAKAPEKIIEEGLLPGKSYNFNLIVGKDKLSIVSVTVADWNNVEEINGGTAEEICNKFDEPTHTITMMKAGTLSQTIIQQALGDGSVLKINGPLNDNDIYTLRDVNISAKTSITSLDLSGVTELTKLPDNSFNNSVNASTTLKSITLSNIITEIGDNAFAECTSLETINLNKVQKIGNSAFKGCIKLNDVDLSSATAIGEYGFYNCSSFTEINAPVLKLLKTSVFENCGDIPNVYLKKATCDAGSKRVLAGINAEEVYLNSCDRLAEAMFANSTIEYGLVLTTENNIVYDENRTFSEFKTTATMLFLNNNKRAGGSGTPQPSGLKCFNASWSQIDYEDSDY